MPIKAFEELSDTKCLIGCDEWDIEKIAIYKHPSPYREFVYLRTRAEQPVPTNNASNINIAHGLQHFPYVEQEYAVYKGKFITREEFDDGAAIINGKPERFTEQPNFRSRFLTPYNLIITSQTSVYNSPDADRIFGRYLNDFLTNGEDANFHLLLEELEMLDNERTYRMDYDI